MPDETGVLFLAHSLRKIEQMSLAIDTCLGRLDDHQIWYYSGSNANAVGNLVLHLAGNLSQWIGHSIGGAPDTRHRESEFSTRGGLSSGHLHILFREAVSDALRIIAALPPERLTDRVQTQDGERTVLEVIYQVVGHLQQHAGQIIFVTKQLTGADLAFYQPPPPPKQ